MTRGPGLSVVVALVLGCAVRAPSLVARVQDERSTLPIPAARPLDDTPLKPFRNYFAVTKVAPLMRHFVASWQRVEGNSGVFTVSPAGEVTLVSGRWGGAASNVADSAEPEQRAAFEAIRADIARRGGTAPHVRFLGEYREVSVSEVVLYEGTDGKRWQATVGFRLAADEGLTTVKGLAGVSAASEQHRPCDPCFAGGSWADVHVERQGMPWALRLWNQRDASLDAQRAAANREVLAAAAALLHGEPRPVEAVSVHRDPALVPETVDDTVEHSLVLLEEDPLLPAPGYGNWWIGGSGGYRVSLSQALRPGGVSDQATFATAAGELVLRSTMRASFVPGAPESGATVLDVEVDFVVSGASEPVHGTVSRRLPVIRDGPRVVPLRRRLDIEGAPPSVPFHHQLRGKPGDVKQLFITFSLEGRGPPPVAKPKQCPACP